MLHIVWVLSIFFSLSSVLVAHASLFIQNISVTVCSIVLMLVFLYKQRIEQIWDGWLTVSTRSTSDHLTTAWLCRWYNENRTDESSLLHLFLSSCVPVVSACELLCAVIVTCCIAKLTQGGLLYGGDRPGRCGQPCKHGTDHCHSEGLDCGYNRLQQRSLGWWEDSLAVNAHT